MAKPLVTELHCGRRRRLPVFLRALVWCLWAHETRLKPTTTEELSRPKLQVSMATAAERPLEDFSKRELAEMRRALRPAGVMGRGKTRGQN